MKARITSTLEVEYERRGGALVVTAPAKYAGKYLVETPRGYRLA